MAEFLLAAEVTLGCLNRCVAKEKLNLLKFSTCEMAAEHRCDASRGEPDS
jgi:hypothetical protein